MKSLRDVPKYSMSALRNRAGANDGTIEPIL